MTHPDDTYLHAAELIAGADALVIAAGAGMGVDSGLPDFRGTDGFWQAYPALAKAHLDFMALAPPLPRCGISATASAKNWVHALFASICVNPKCPVPRTLV